LPHATNLPVFELAQTLPGRFRLPARMTVLTLVGGGLALVSPIPIDEALARTLASLGEVRFLIAPNLLHHLYLHAASQRYPRAIVLAPPGLARKRPGLRIDRTLQEPLPVALTDSVDVHHIAGAPTVDEFVFFHRATRSLVVTDLVFHVLRPEGWLTNLVLRLVGCHRRFGQSRAFRLFVKDRPAAAHSIERVLALPFETLIMAHGEIVRGDAQHDPRAMLADAVRWLLPLRTALPARAL
jgi:hypothetical protein